MGKVTFKTTTTNNDNFQRVVSGLLKQMHSSTNHNLDVIRTDDDTIVIQPMGDWDYCINFNGKLVYIELAGILGNKEHQEAYRNNTPLKSKSKEEYRLKLNQKREIFERNNLEYYILLPDEMNEETYKNILKKYLKEAA